MSRMMADLESFLWELKGFLSFLFYLFLLIFVFVFERSGKSSIEKVVFHKMSPHETLFLEPTNDVRVREIHNNPLVHLQVLDFPGNFDFAEEDDLNVDAIFKACGALVLVIDAQDEPHTEAIEYVVKIAEAAYKVIVLFESSLS
jgi:Ras-related GTP-binding protein C/D